jgi:hypothetical protein
MYDDRLIGAWKSDARLTDREIDARRDISTARRKKLKQYFGKMELKYTRTQCSVTLNGITTVRRYRVVAKDACSVVVLSVSPVVGGQLIYLRFEGRHYWICLGKFREYFKRTGEARKR